MRRFALAMSVLFAVAIVFAAPASAARIGGEVFGAFNTHGMDDVNDAIDGFNSSGADFNNISNGITGGLGVRVWPNSNVMLAATWEPLFLSSKDETNDAELKTGANSFQATVGYFFPTLAPAKFGVAGGLGYYVQNGELLAGGVSFGDIEGSGIGYHFMGMTEMTVSPGFAVAGSAGWRIADITIDDSDPEITSDYSGFMARVGLAFYLPTP